jgi:hypothetical protein
LNLSHVSADSVHYLEGVYGILADFLNVFVVALVQALFIEFIYFGNLLRFGLVSHDFDLLQN